MGEEYPLLDHEFYLFVLENARTITKLIHEVQQTTEMYDITYFGLETLKNKYLLKTHCGYKESIDNFFIRVSLFVQTNLEIALRYVRVLPRGYSLSCHSHRAKPALLTPRPDPSTHPHVCVKTCSLIAFLWNSETIRR